MGKVIIIDDNPVYCDYVGNLLAKSGIPAEKIYSLQAAKKALLKIESDDIILSDLRFPNGDGIELLKYMREAGHRNPFFIMTDYDEVPTAVRSMKSGAEDYISKRILETELLPRLLALWKRQAQSASKKEKIYDRESEAFRKIRHRIKLVAPTDISVLILGDNGTGKDHIAGKIHEQSDRTDKPFVAVDCSVLTPSLAASILFGHEKGAFTGAISSRKGYFEEANGGTIFLDEVAELPLTTQARLLRVLESGEFIKVGSSEVQKTNIRVVAATNVNMQKAVAEGRFREDLYYRLSTIFIVVPPLRDRGDDIILLSRKFSRDFADKYRMPAIEFEDSAKSALLSYRWPGNVRQLKNLIEQISLFDAGRKITADEVAAYLPYAGGEFTPAVAPGEMLHSYEKEREMLFKMIFEMRKEIDNLRDDIENLAQGQPRQNIGTIKNLQKNFAPQAMLPQHALPASQPNEAEFINAEPHDDATMTLEDTERETIKRSLERNEGKRKKTAEELKISERTLYRKIKEYGLE